MLRHDLAAAEIPYEDVAGLVFDFHALQHQFISNLAAAGVHPKIAQTLARHATIGLTMDRHTHLAVADVAGALDNLPALPADLAAGKSLATGTDGGTDVVSASDRKPDENRPASDPRFMRMVALNSDLPCLPLSTGGQMDAARANKKTPNSLSSKELGEVDSSCPSLTSARPTGLEPATTGRQSG